jgi:hypothetical protein
MDPNKPLLSLNDLEVLENEWMKAHKFQVRAMRFTTSFMALCLLPLSLPLGFTIAGQNFGAIIIAATFTGLVLVLYQLLADNTALLIQEYLEKRKDKKDEL